MKSSPVFISLLYRSGSTVLTLALDQTKELKVSYDIIHFMRFSHGNYLPLEQRFHTLLVDTQNRIKERWKVNIKVESISKNIKKHDVITEAVVYDEIMKSYLNLKNNQRWVDRTAVKWEGILPFLQMFPNGRVIHIYRDPRAVLASYKNMTYHPGIMYMDAIFSSLSMFNYIEQECIKQNKNIYLLKYEDLVCDPVNVLKSICDFIEVNFTERMLRVDSFKNQFGESFDGNSSFKGLRKSFDKKTMNIWKEKLNNVEIYIAELVLKDKLRKFQYELTGIDINQKESDEVYKIFHSEFINKRYKYWLKTGNGLQAYPDTEGAYSEQ